MVNLTVAHSRVVAQPRWAKAAYMAFLQPTRLAIYPGWMRSGEMCHCQANKGCSDVHQRINPSYCHKSF